MKNYFKKNNWERALKRFNIQSQKHVLKIAWSKAMALSSQKL